MLGIVRKHLIAKLALVLILTVGIGFAVPALFNAQHQLRAMEDMSEHAASSVAKGLAAGVRNAMLTGEGITAREMMGEARTTISGLSLRVYAPNGEEVFAPRGDAPDPTSLPAHVKHVMENVSGTDGPNGGAAIPIPNERRCRICHGKEKIRGVLSLSTKDAKVAAGEGDAAADLICSMVDRAFLQLMTADQSNRLPVYFEELAEEVDGIAGVALYDAEADFAMGDDELEIPVESIKEALRLSAPKVIRVAKPKKKKKRKKNPEPDMVFRVNPLKNQTRCHSCHDPEPPMRGVLIVRLDDEMAGQTDLALSQSIEVSLTHVMLSGLGRLIRSYLDAVAASGAVTHLTVHDHEGRLYKDAFVKPTPPDNVAAALGSGTSFAQAKEMTSGEAFTFVEPMQNEERCQRCHGADHEIRGAIEVMIDTSEQASGRVRLAQVGIAFGMGTVMAVLALLVILLRLLVLRPVGEIGDVADKVAEGDLEASVDVRTSDEVGRLGARINQMVVELKKKLALSKFVSDATVASIDQSAGEVSRKGERREVTVLFSDVRGFTAFSETKEPEQVVEMLNLYLNVQSERVIANQGDIDKFVGDELMAHFTGPDAPQRAIRAAVEMVEAVEKANASLPGDLSTIAVGVGINAGEVVFGAMGAEDRMDFTVIGDAVNLGARLCSAAERHQVLVSGETRDMVGELPGLKFTELEPIKVKGKADPIRIYQVQRAA